MSKLTSVSPITLSIQCFLRDGRRAPSHNSLSRVRADVDSWRPRVGTLGVQRATLALCLCAAGHAILGGFC